MSFWQLVHQIMLVIVARYWIEKIAGVPVNVEVASEYRYRQPASSHLSHAIAISQSGESLDTLMAMRYAQEQGPQAPLVL